jgi:hypothetical protein
MGLLKVKMEKGICQPNCWSNSLVELLSQITGSNLTPLCSHRISDALVRLRPNLPPVLAWAQLVLAAGCLILPASSGWLRQDFAGNKGRQTFEPQTGGFAFWVPELPRVDLLVRLADPAGDAADGILQGDSWAIGIHERPH